MSDLKRTQFGNRYLTDDKDVFDHNAWDDIQWDNELIESIETKVKMNALERISTEKADQLERDANLLWDQFYDKHETNFFKDRHWLFTEFPELNTTEETKTTESEENCQPLHVLEIGCGVGNTVFPVLQINSNPNLMIYCCDFSSTAISLVKSNALYDQKRCNAFTLDVTCDDWLVPFPKSSLNIITIIFVLSAIDPNRMQSVMTKVVDYLKPGGLILFRDYGRYDMTQVRFKAGHCLKDNFYVRGDGTRVYFFSEEEIDSMFTNAGLTKCFLKSDKRLQVNRAKRVRMYRVWIQAKYCKTIIHN
ncbi:tRNA N(3)-methylcytidine methyltransferase METTL2-like isoform X2 [Oppia nitens]|uniref:tRNA N(3)-methylcytidine methyltransferase METTL2-like isoform X2 n=1 Tax=Oppia nitens TaxID=1686743 RepID=UPI0023DB64EE|nr:tRNA N(3)-methylcytidine methyltransferase METTL2-like isoform X2 [Oppia nitens]